MLEFFKQNYEFSLMILVLTIALIMFRNDKDITHTIIGALVGFVTAPRKN